MKLRRQSLAAAVVAGASAGLLFLPAAPASADSDPTDPEPWPRICTIIGSGGNDILNGTPDDDVLCGLGGNDILIGYGGDDIFFGGSGRDHLIGGYGRDEMHGGPGPDLLIDTQGQSWEDGGQGVDRCFGVVSTIFDDCERVIAFPLM